MFPKDPKDSKDKSPYQFKSSQKVQIPQKLSETTQITPIKTPTNNQTAIILRIIHKPVIKEEIVPKLKLIKHLKTVLTKNYKNYNPDSLQSSVKWKPLSTPTKVLSLEVTLSMAHLDQCPNLELQLEKEEEDLEGSEC